jgi:hypothetical protein
MSSANLSRRNSTVTTASSLRNNRTETETENSVYSQNVPDQDLFVPFQICLILSKIYLIWISIA